MGLLDYLNKGFNNSVGHLNNLKDSFANQPKMYDPHANARALMGGQAMQPQSLIAEQTPQVNVGQPEVSTIPVQPTQTQTQQMTYNPNVTAGVDYPNYDSSAINPYLDGDQTGTVGGYVDNSYNNRINNPMVSSLLMGNAQTPQGVVGVDSNVPIVQQVQSETAITSPYVDLQSQIQENITPELVDERQRAYDELVRRGILSPKR